MQLHYHVSRTSAGGLRTLTRPTAAKHIQYYNKYNQYMNSDYYDDKSRRIPTQPTDVDRSRQVPTGRDGYKQITADTTDADISRQLQTGSNRPQQFPTAPDRCRHIHRDPNGCRQIPTDTQSSRHIPTDPDRSRHPRHRYSTSSLTPSPPKDRKQTHLGTCQTRPTTINTIARSTSITKYTQTRITLDKNEKRK